MIPEIAIDGPAYRAWLIRTGRLVPVEQRRTPAWWHPETRTLLLLGVPEEKIDRLYRPAEPSETVH